MTGLRALALLAALTAFGTAVGLVLAGQLASASPEAVPATTTTAPDQSTPAPGAVAAATPASAPRPISFIHPPGQGVKALPIGTASLTVAPEAALVRYMDQVQSLRRRFEGALDLVRFGSAELANGTLSYHSWLVRNEALNLVLDEVLGDLALVEPAPSTANHHGSLFAALSRYVRGSRRLAAAGYPFQPRLTGVDARAIAADMAYALQGYALIPDDPRLS